MPMPMKPWIIISQSKGTSGTLFSYLLCNKLVSPDTDNDTVAKHVLLDKEKIAWAPITVTGANNPSENDGLLVDNKQHMHPVGNTKSKIR